MATITRRRWAASPLLLAAAKLSLSTLAPGAAVPIGAYSVASPALDYVVLNGIPGLETSLDAPKLAAASESDSSEYVCKEGTYCLNAVAYLCPAGTRGSSTGSFDYRCDGPCESGFYCPQGSVLAAPPERTCGNASYYCPSGSREPSPVSEGYYTIGGRTASRGGGTADAAPEECYSVKEPNDFGVAAADPEAVTSACANVGGALQHGVNTSVHGEAQPLLSVTPCEVPRNSLSGPASVRPWSIYRYCTGAAYGDADTRSGQQQCEPGSFCWKGMRYKCAPGRYGDRFGETSPNCSGKCAAGFRCEGYGNTAPDAVPCGSSAVYCPEGSAFALPVDRGFYTDPSQPPDQRTRQLLCPPGKWCPGDGMSHPCPAGAFGDVSGLSTPSCAGFCSPGYFCPTGSTSAQQVECGLHRGASVYCPAGAARPVAVSPGYYSTGGYEKTVGLPQNTTRTGQMRCEPGHYCIAGMKIQCPAGSFGSDVGLASADCTGACEPGHFCPPGSVSPRQYRCGDVYFALVDVLSALMPLHNYSASPPAPLPDVLNPARPMLNPAAAYDYVALYRLYSELQVGAALDTGSDGSAANSEGLTQWSVADIATNGSAAINITAPLLQPGELANATSVMYTAADGKTLLLLISIPFSSGQVAATNGTGSVLFNSLSSLNSSDIAVQTNGANLTLTAANVTAAIGPPPAAAGGALSAAVIRLLLPISVPWEAGSRALLPPVAVPIDSFAATHRLLVHGGPGGVWCPAGSGWPQTVPAGFYSTSNGSALSASDLGNLTRDGIAIVEPGSYAVAGLKLPCNSGTYGNASGLTRRMCSGYCPAGFACSLGSPLPLQCPAGTYAPPGSPACLPCPVPSTMQLQALPDPVDADDPGSGAASLLLQASSGTLAGNGLALQGRSASADARGCRHARHCCGL